MSGVMDDSAGERGRGPELNISSKVRIEPPMHTGLNTSSILIEIIHRRRLSRSIDFRATSYLHK